MSRSGRELARQVDDLIWCPCSRDRTGEGEKGREDTVAYSPSSSSRRSTLSSTAASRSPLMTGGRSGECVVSSPAVPRRFGLTMPNACRIPSVAGHERWSGVSGYRS